MSNSYVVRREDCSHHNIFPGVDIFTAAARRLEGSPIGQLPAVQHDGAVAHDLPDMRPLYGPARRDLERGLADPCRRKRNAGLFARKARPAAATLVSPLNRIPPQSHSAPIRLSPICVSARVDFNLFCCERPL